MSAATTLNHPVSFSVKKKKYKIDVSVLKIKSHDGKADPNSGVTPGMSSVFNKC